MNNTGLGPLTFLRFFFTRHPLLASVFAGALVVMLVFAVKLLVHLTYFHDRAGQEQPLEAWMRPRYVAMSYDLPPEVVATLLGVDVPAERHGGSIPTIGEIAAAQGVTLEVLTERLRAGAAAYHESEGQ